jgi:hypothetical protein
MYGNRGSARWDVGKDDQAALADMREAIRIFDARIGETPALAATLAAFATMNMQLEGRASGYPESRAAAERALAIVRRTMRDGEQEQLTIMGNIALVRGHVRDVDGSVALFDEALAIAARTGATGEHVTDLRHNRNSLLAAFGRCPEIVGDAEQVAAEIAAQHGADSPRRIFSLKVLGQCLMEVGRPAEAVKHLEIAVALPVPASMQHVLEAARAQLKEAQSLTSRTSGQR